MLNSLQRQYLKALGIPLWVPRAPLPGAKALREDPPSAPPVDPKASTVPVMQEVAEQKEGIAAFRLVSWLFQGRCLIVSDFDLAQDAHVTKAQHCLLTDLLRCLGIDDPESAQPQFYECDAPEPAEGGSLESVAQQYLKKRLAGQDVQFVLVMGTLAARLLLPHESALANARGRRWSVFEYSALITHSLDSMLLDPMLKREVWQEIQPLCAKP